MAAIRNETPKSNITEVRKQMCTMKNFYTNRNFNFLTLFTKNKDIDYKLRFNQDIFTQREFDPSLKKP